MNTASRLVWAGILLLTACATTNSTELRQKKADIFFRAGIDALSQNNYSEALGALQESAQLNPKSPAVWTNLGLAYLGKGESARAEESFKKALTIDHKWTDARTNLGGLYLQEKRLKEAEKVLKEVLKDLVYPRSYFAHYSLSRIYAEWHRPMLVEQHLRLALSNNPQFCVAWFDLGLIQKDRGDFDDAATSLSKSVNGTCFNNPRAHYEIGSLLIKAHETDRAKSKLLEVIQLFPQSEWAKKAEITLNMIR